MKDDGTLWGWGHGQYGKLGNGTTSNQMSPTQVSTGTGLANVVQVAAGIQHTLALDADGDVWAWGLRTNGALGDNSTTSSATTPQQVSGVSDIVAMAAGYQLSAALESDGDLWVWGRNSEGQLGDGTTVDKKTPVQVSNHSGITAISAGHYHLLALQNEGPLSGSLWSLGYNNKGQLGDGTSSNSSMPLRVVLRNKSIQWATMTGTRLEPVHAMRRGSKQPRRRGSGVLGGLNVTRKTCVSRFSTTPIGTGEVQAESRTRR